MLINASETIKSIMNNCEDNQTTPVTPAVNKKGNTQSKKLVTRIAMFT